jgi:hypothetical protein
MSVVAFMLTDLEAESEISAQDEIQTTILPLSYPIDNQESNNIPPNIYNRTFHI